LDYSFIIRRARVEDAKDVYNILQKAFKEYAEAVTTSNKLVPLQIKSFR
jgi:hypothetical protein